MTREFLSIKRINFFTDPIMQGWNIFDLTLVLLMAVENYVLSWAISGGANISQLSALRLLREHLARLVPPVHKARPDARSRPLGSC